MTSVHKAEINSKKKYIYIEKDSEYIETLITESSEIYGILVFFLHFHIAVKITLD